jgi:putative spermidine/putrescine transport system substrate-binding protein
MVDRRLFLQGLGLWIASQGLVGCGAVGDGVPILFLRGSLPPQLIRLLRQGKGGQPLSFQSLPQRKEIFKRLQTWQEKDIERAWWQQLPWERGPAEIAGLATLGDYWLAGAIEKKLIQPVPVESLSGWERLPQAWQQLVRRDRQGNVAERGEIWGAPYRWGATIIAYRRDKLKWQPRDWPDLWRTEITRKISIVDQPREVIGLVLKSLGHSYNTRDLGAIASLKSRFSELQQQVLYYSSTHYLQPLILGDAWLAVGWSGDILPLLKTNPDIGAVIPRSGTALWGDLWVRPRVRPTQPEAEFPVALRSLLESCWQPDVAEQIARLTAGSSPILRFQPPDVPDLGKSQLLRSADPEIISRSEFLEPLSPRVSQQYDGLWREVRSLPA